MKKHEFEAWLRQQLGSVPLSEAEKFLHFYLGGIDDRMEDGMTEEEAVSAMGTQEEILEQIRTSTPKLPQSAPRPRHTGRWVLGGVLLAALLLGLPLFFLISQFAAPSSAGTRNPLPVQQSDPLPNTSFPVPAQPTEENALVFSAQEGQRIEIDVEFGSVKVEQAADDQITVELADPTLFRWGSRNGTLSIESKDVHLMQAQLDTAVVLHIPDGDHLLEIDNETGNVELRNLSLRQIDVECETGNITLSDTSASTALLLSCDVGSVEGTLPGTMADYTISSSVDIGDNSLPTRQRGGSVRLDVSVDVGSILIDFQQ